jgi:hypothetical protein
MSTNFIKENDILAFFKKGITEFFSILLIVSISRHCTCCVSTFRVNF